MTNTLTTLLAERTARRPETRPMLNHGPRDEILEPLGCGNLVEEFATAEVIAGIPADRAHRMRGGNVGMTATVVSDNAAVIRAGGVVADPHR